MKIDCLYQLMPVTSFFITAFNLGCKIRGFASINVVFRDHM